MVACQHESAGNCFVAMAGAVTAIATAVMAKFTQLVANMQMELKAAADQSLNTSLAHRLRAAERVLDAASNDPAVLVWLGIVDWSEAPPSEDGGRDEERR